ncbi:MAG: hypothetical protein ACE144_20795 [Thermodesulfobacteriota bacterium]
MELPAASGGVSGGIPPKPTRLCSLSFGAVSFGAIAHSSLWQATGYYGEGE